MSTSEWIMTLFAMASLIEFVPLLSLCILDPVRKLTHYFRWLNAREAYPQCTEAASLVSFALHWATRLLFVTNWTWRYNVHPSPLRMLFLFGWPPCQRSDMTLVEVSQHAYGYLCIRTIVLFVFLRNSCKPDMVLVYIMLNKLCLSLSLSLSHNFRRSTLEAYKHTVTIHNSTQSRMGFAAKYVLVLYLEIKRNKLSASIVETLV